MSPPPAVDGDVRAVGGGDINGAGTTGNFAMGGSRRDGASSGHLTLIGSPCEVFHEDVVCIGATALPDGTKLARLIGRITNPGSPSRSLLSNVSGSGRAGVTATPSRARCRPRRRRISPREPTPGIDPIAHGNISKLRLKPAER